MDEAWTSTSSEYPGTLVRILFEEITENRYRLWDLDWRPFKTAAGSTIEFVPSLTVTSRRGFTGIFD
jgi:hypothetical protein